MNVLQLPSVPVSKTLSHLDFKEVIQLAFLSKRATNMVLAAGSSLKTPPTARIRCEGGPDHIMLLGENRTKFIWYLKEDEDWGVQPLLNPREEFRDQVVDGVKKRVCFHDFCLSIIGSGADDFLFGFKFLKRIFRFQIDFLGLRFENDVQSFQKLMVDTHFFHKGNDYGLTTTGLSPEQLTFTFDNCDFKGLSTFGSLPEGFQYGSGLGRYQELDLQHSSERRREVPGRIEEWMTMDQVWNIANSGTTRQMDLHPLNYTSEDVNGFIKNWLASDNRTFEYLKLGRLRARRKSDPLNQQVVFNGIQKFLGAKKSKTARKRYETRVHFEKGTDIRRRDGLWATVLFCKTNDQKEVHFVVWYDENPNA